jgi:predicted nucleic-acid-binding Zn-ribbon protein
MRKTRRCPKCASESLWYVKDVAANRKTGSWQRQPTFHLAVTGDGPEAYAGLVEAYACQPCGYVEMYLKEPLVADGENVVDLRGAAGFAR